MAEELGQGAGRVRGRQGHDRRVMSDDREPIEEQASRRRGVRRLVLRGGVPVEITEGPERETR